MLLERHAKSAVSWAREMGTDELRELTPAELARLVKGLEVEEHSCRRLNILLGWGFLLC